jgi:hypothetical protein
MGVQIQVPIRVEVKWLLSDSQNPMQIQNGFWHTYFENNGVMIEKRTMGLG